MIGERGCALRLIHLSLLGAIHTSELDRSEIDLSPKRSECERSNANWDRSKIDLNKCEHFLKANWDRSQIDFSVNGPLIDRRTLLTRAPGSEDWVTRLGKLGNQIG